MPRIAFTVLTLLACACDHTPSAPAQAQSMAQSSGQPAAMASGAALQQRPDIAALAGRINTAEPVFKAGLYQPATGLPFDPVLIRLEAMLMQARFSPGVIDGRWGSNLAHALAAYQQSRGLRASPGLNQTTWQVLMNEPSSRVSQPLAYGGQVLSAAVLGPMAPDVGEDMVKLAALPDGPRFTTPLEAMAENTRVSQGLLTALNPGVDFTHAGLPIVMIAPGPMRPFAPDEIARITVSKADASVQVFNKADRLIAFFPATVGSTDRPSPSGVHTINGAVPNPDYTYDPAKLTWGPRAAGKLVIKPGPNNPVGTEWIDLDAPGYGLHGTPDPDHIGKTASHGCVRMTNWDAQALAKGVRPGLKVTFVGERGAPPA